MAAEAQYPLMQELPRGGYLVNTSEGLIQFGSPPETIKDTIGTPLGTPSVFVLPLNHFDPSIGISLAEIEFPTYYNFFIKKRKVEVYVHPDQINLLYTVFKEAFLGPDNVDVENEIEKTEDYYIPQIMEEMKYFRSGLKITDLLDIRPIDSNGITRGRVKIIPAKDQGFDVFDQDNLIAKVPGRMKSQVRFDLGKTLNEPFIPPEFGITCLGPSHGFDPKQNTSGFVLWINKTGIMVDPPVNITTWLKESNVNPKLIDSVILTHCHADHDAGTFQKILEETKIRVYTTPTILESFLTKYSALTRIPAKTLMTLFEFNPVKMNLQYNIHGAFFNFYYSIHSIPTIGFYFLYRDKTFLYSSDHLADPQVLNSLHEKGVLCKERLDFFINKAWEMDIIYHEAGIPPLHTPVRFLNSLTPEMQKKITVYHIAEKDFPETTNLTLAKFGIGATVLPEIKKQKHEQAFDILDVFSRIEMFRDLPFDKSKFLLLNTDEESFSRGDYIIKKNTPGDKFYVIISGNVSIGGIENVSEKVYGTYEYFGEVSLVFGTPRTADVIAATNVRAYSLKKQAFLRLIEGTKVEEHIRRLAKMRNGETWNTIKINPLFEKLSSSQITQLEGYLSTCEIKKNEPFLCQDKGMEAFYILIEGVIQKQRDGEKAIQCKKGELIGCFSKLNKELTDYYRYTLLTDVRFYRIEIKDFSKFLDANPGVLMTMIFENR